jgi:1-acyl-sn-glycerol-3-phosphate acyltransferase
VIQALRQRQPGSPLWRIAFWHFFHFLWYLVLVPFYRYRAFNINNIPRTGPVLLVSNHQSFLDLPIIAMACTRRHFVPLARSGLFDHPLFAWLIRNLNAIPVVQGESDIAAIRKCIKVLGQGHVLLIFPEGQRTLSGEVEPFETGTMLVIKRARPMVVPVAVEGGFDIWRRGQARPKLRGRIGVTFGKPIPPDTLIQMGAGPGLEFLRRQISEMRDGLAERLAGCS